MIEVEFINADSSLLRSMSYVYSEDDTEVAEVFPVCGT